MGWRLVIFLLNNNLLPIASTPFSMLSQIIIERIFIAWIMYRQLSNVFLLSSFGLLNITREKIVVDDAEAEN